MSITPSNLPPLAARAYERPLCWVLWLLVGAAVAALLVALKSALVPFLLAFIVAYVFAPWVDYLSRRLRLPRAASTSIVFLLIVAIVALLLVGLLPVIQSQLSELLQKLPGAVSRLRQQGLPLVSNLLAGVDLPTSKSGWMALMEDGLGQFGPVLFKGTTGLVKWAASSTLGVMLWVVSAAIIPVLLFYMLVDFPQLAQWLKQRLPASSRQQTTVRLGRIDTMLGEYLRGQLIVGVLLSVLYAIGLTLAGVDAAIPIAIIAGLGNMVPYLGFVLGISLSLIISLLTQFDPMQLLFVVLVFVVVQGLEGMFISPKVVGDRVGLHPLAIILALFVGGESFGIVGVILGVPAAIAVKVALESMSGADGNDMPPDPPPAPAPVATEQQG